MSADLRTQMRLAAKQSALVLTHSVQRARLHKLRCEALRLASLLLLMACMQLVGITSALAWTLFESKTLYEEVELSASEAKKVQYAAGWSAQSDPELLVEVKNNLPGPLACHGATVHVLSGGTVSKGFVPRLYIPSASSRQGAVGGVKKGQMKDFSVTCHCWKKPGDTACGNPSNKKAQPAD